MPRLRGATLSVVAVLLATAACAALAPKTPVVVCPRVPLGPTMDGNVELAEWAGAGCLSDFMSHEPRGMPRLPTRAYVMHTESALYIGAQMYDDKPDELTANVTERDGKVYEDDCIELFIDVEGARREYAHLVVNSLGWQFDEYGHDSAENFVWNVVAAVNEIGWAIEIELPFDDGMPPMTGETWNLGVCRNAAHAREVSTWSRHARSFHEPEAFGEMTFVAPMLSVRMDDLGDRLLGDNLALVTVENLGTTPATVKANVVVMGKDRRSHYFGTVKQQLDGRASAQIYVPYKVRRCGEAWLTLSLTDGAGVVAWRSGAFPIELPDVSDALDDTAHAIALSWKAWVSISQPEAKETLSESIEALQMEWSYLDTQMSAGAGMSAERLFAVGEEARRLQWRAEALAERVRSVAAQMSGG